MSAFLYTVTLHWKLNFRSKEILVHFYIVPLVFYGFMGALFTQIDPEAYRTILAGMTGFGVTMGAILGSPYPLVEFYGSEMKKAYQVGHIPIWTMAVGNFISAFLHLFTMSLIIYFTAPLMFGALRPDPAAYFTALPMLLIASLSIGTVLGLIFGTPSKMGMGGQLIFLPSVLLSGIMLPVGQLPDSLQRLGKFFPVTWGFQGMCGDGPDGVCLLVLFIFAAAGLLLSCIKIIRIRRTR